MAWCIVPFDGKQRTPRERAELLPKIGLHRLAYDYRDEHLPTFSEELDLFAVHNIELTACMILGDGQDPGSQAIFNELITRNLRPQLWWIVDCGSEVPPPLPAGEQAARVAQFADILRPMVEKTAAAGFPVALYNHGGWFGEPENQIQIIEKLGFPHMGMVYNFHHAHHHISRFASLWSQAHPHVLAINLNGMVENGPALGKKILPIGLGDHETEMMAIVERSGWHGPVGVLNHTDCDAEARLLDNLDGLRRIRAGDTTFSENHPPLRSWNGADILCT